MRTVAALAFLALAFLTDATPADAAQIGDPNADVSVAAPAFAKNEGPVVAIDAGHSNFHTLDGRFGPFARLLANDGFRLKAHTGAFTSASLDGISILVIANALNPANTTNWSLPTLSAFTADEIAAVKAFVKKGGALLLIADHMPFGGAAVDLAKAFEITFINGFAFYGPDPAAPDFFTAADGSLGDDPIARDADTKAPFARIATFTGSAFRAPGSARRLLLLNNNYVVMTPQTAWQFPPETPRLSGEGLAQGAVLAHGKGRLAVFGEAAMFTAQTDDQDPSVRMGFTAPGAENNKAFILNVARWLAGRLGP